MATSTALESPTTRIQPRPGRFVLAFLLALIATLAMGIALLLGVLNAYQGRTLPGVHVGNVDVGGLTRDEAAAKLENAYAALGAGTVDVMTPSGSEVLSYAEVGRRPDVAAMTAAALQVGHTSDLFASIADAARSIAGGTTVPVRVALDPAALAARLHASSAANDVPPHDATVRLAGGRFAVTPAAPGRGLDEQAIGQSIVSRLSSPAAPSTITVDAREVAIPPSVSDGEAQRAAHAASLMAVDVPLGSGATKVTIPAATIRGAIRFRIDATGTYAASVDTTRLAAAVAQLTKDLATPAVEPMVLNDKGGKPVGLTGGKNGTAVDADATTQNAAAYLAALAAGTPASPPALVMREVPPKLSQNAVLAALPSMKKLSSWTVIFYSGIANGFGANIRVPTGYVNGTVLAPGDQFSFLDAVGPITPARGFKPGGVIINGKSDFTGAIGGGICSASTTLFNAALRAGLEIDERHNHAYYIDRYPVGLDATVFEDTGEVADMKFTNDTKNPILIVGRSTYSTVTYEIWGVPDGRTVKVSHGPQTNVVQPGPTTTQKVTTLPPGQSLWAEYPTPGFNVWAYRTVTATDGTTLHSDSFYSHYITVDGVLQVGVTSNPTPTPAPTPAPSPTH